MEGPTLVVSDPPHQEVVDLERVAELLGLDIYVTKLKVNFAAPEILSVSEPGEAIRFAADLGGAGLSVSVQTGAAMKDPPWPVPVSTLVLDESGLRATTPQDSVEIGVDEDVFGVYCCPPPDFRVDTTVDPARAVASGHGPTVAAGIQWMGILDLYTRAGGALRRATIVPELLGLDPAGVVTEVKRRLGGLQLDERLAGVRPRGRFVMGEAGFDPDKRKRYSFGTLLLCHVLESIDPELRNITHYEYGSRLAYAMGPMSA
jgi:hypothetical protein